ncbi:MAG: efflux transporter periplasmic adaptor subunit, partial [Verrucomicrobia bacterium]|nr:efflux transporter periplasmic adaptor subunit [Verrucomicrobiota bacterium]
MAAGLVAGLWPRWRQGATLRRDSIDLGVQYVSVVHPRPSTNQTEFILPGEAQPFIEAPIYA